MQTISLLRHRGKADTLIDMGAALIALFVLLGGAGLLVLFAIGQYNTLITLRNRYKNDFSLIAMQLKRRYDLISRLVETAKKSLGQSRDILETVASSRNSAYTAATKAAADPGSPQAMRDLLVAEAGLHHALARLGSVAEAYPDCRANHDMLRLSEELGATESRILLAGQAYNDAVTAYNLRREAFPSNMIARVFHFAAAERFQIEPVIEKLLPKVSLT